MCHVCVCVCVICVLVMFASSQLKELLKSAQQSVAMATKENEEQKMCVLECCCFFPSFLFLTESRYRLLCVCTAEGW